MRRAVRPAEQLLLYNFRYHVADQGVALLNPWYLVRRGTNTLVRQSS